MRSPLWIPGLLLTLLGILACSDGDVFDVDSGADFRDPHALETVPVSVAGGSGEQAGTAVAPVGDVDGDGFVDLAVGASGGAAVCVFSRPIGAGTELHEAQACALGEAGSGAGAALAVGDLDADGNVDFLVGGPGTDPVGEAGAAWLVSGPLPAGESTLSATDRSWFGVFPGDAFGAAVAFAGDPDGDGVPDVLLGAPGNDDAAPDAGAVYLFAAEALVVTPTAVFLGGEPLDPAGTVPDGVGTALCPAGDLDGDGVDDVVVSAPGSDRWERDGGAVAIYDGPIAAMTHTLDDADTLLLSLRALGRVGDAIACGGDTDGDGHGELLIGAPGAGIVYLWRSGDLDDAVLDRNVYGLGGSVAFVPGERPGVLVGSPTYEGWDDQDEGMVNWYSGITAEGGYREHRWWYGIAGSRAGASVAAFTQEPDQLFLAVGAPAAEPGGFVYVFAESSLD